MAQPTAAGAPGFADLARLAKSVLPPLAVGAAAAALVLGKSGIDPTNLGWCCGGDCETHYLGWAFFRASPWTLPLGMNPRYGLEIGSSIFYSDSIPLAALVFKPLRSLLPAHFQYLGLWVALCFLLQAWFAWQLLGRLAPSVSRWTRWLGLGLFVFSPPLLIRIGGHTPLASHWLLLAALSLYLGSPRTRLVAWPLLSLAASLIHSYLLIMVLALWCAHVARRCWELGTRKRALSLEAGLVLAAAAFGLWQGGFFAVRVESPGGFGELAMNLLAPFNPDAYSYLVPPLAPPFRGFHEGYNFLGLGCLLLLPIILVALARRRARIELSKKDWPLIGVLAGLTLFALSNHIGIGTLSLTIPLPQSLIDRASILRSSGRMFWPVYYTLIAAGVAVVLRSHRERVAGGLLAAASLVQILDTRAGWKPQHDGYRIQSRSTCRSPLVSPFWAAAGASYHELRRVPLRHHADDYATFAAYAAERGLGTDSAYLARVDPTALQEAAERSEDAITTGNFDPDTLYVLDETHAELAAGTLDRRGDLLARVDGFFVLAPAWQKRKPPAAVTPLALGRRDIIPGIVLGHEVSFGAGGEGERYLRSGWGAPEPWGVWADAADAELSLPIVPGTSNLHVEVEAGALVAPRQSTQQVECQINGSWSTLLEFSVEHNTGWRTLPVPSAALEQSRESETLRVVFHMLNPVSPEALGLNADTRRLGMTLHRAKVSRTD